MGFQDWLEAFWGKDWATQNPVAVGWMKEGWEAAMAKGTQEVWQQEKGGAG